MIDYGLCRVHWPGPGLFRLSLAARRYLALSDGGGFALLAKNGKRVKKLYKYLIIKSQVLKMWVCVLQPLLYKGLIGLCMDWRHFCTNNRLCLFWSRDQKNEQIFYWSKLVPIYAQTYAGPLSRLVFQFSQTLALALSIATLMASPLWLQYCHSCYNTYLYFQYLTFNSQVSNIICLLMSKCKTTSKAETNVFF